MTKGSVYPFSQDDGYSPIGSVTVQGNTDWVILQTGCQQVTPVGANIHSSGTFNTKLTGY